MSEKEMPAKAALIEMRSDWDWNVKWYGAATHNTKVSCCWLCSAKPDTWKALSDQERKDMSLTKAAWFETLAQRGKKTNPLFDLPGVTNWTLFPDWMHVADEGVLLWQLAKFCGKSCPSTLLPTKRKEQGYCGNISKKYMKPENGQATKDCPSFL